MDEEARLALLNGVADLDETGVLVRVAAALSRGEDPVQIVTACEAGMRLVGERYERREYYLSGLIMAGEIFREVLEATQPALQGALAGTGQGKVLVGTVQGDIHDIGKSIFQVALHSYGFTVEDLGVDVAPAAFVARTLEWQPDVIGLSGLLSTAYDSMRETVRLLQAQDWSGRRPVPVLIGGGMINEQVRRYVGADYWCGDALEGVRLCQRIMDRQRHGVAGG